MSSDTTDGDGEPRGRGGGGGSAGSPEAGEERPSPARIPVTPPPEAEGELAGVYRSMGARHGVSNILGVQSLHPAALSAHVDLYRTLMFGPSPLSRAERESVAVVVSAANDCFY